jgi:hypothetical protein
VDLGCGRGGPGLSVTRQTGATLIGIDLSPISECLRCAVAHGSSRVTDHPRSSPHRRTGAPPATGHIDRQFSTGCLIQGERAEQGRCEGGHSRKRVLGREQGRLTGPARGRDPGARRGIGAKDTTDRPGRSNGRPGLVMSVRELTYAEAVREAVAEEMRRHSRVFLIGEDVGRRAIPSGC